METITTTAEYIKAVNAAKYHDHLYFALNAPAISDTEYDALYFAIQDYEDTHPADVLPDSPTQKCYGENGNGKRTVARRTPCLSMRKMHDSDDMLSYLRAQAEKAGTPAARVDVEWKFDGETVALVYTRGTLTEATYGHGKELMGIDCLDRIKHVRGVPAAVDAWSAADRVEVRGEVVVSLDNFARYRRSKKSPRTMSNGIMQQKRPNVAECALLEFRPFRLIAEGSTCHALAMMELMACGFLDSGHVGTFTLAEGDDLIDTIDEIITNAETQRTGLPYPTDGLVFKFDDYTTYDTIGYTAHDAKHNAAYKFQPVYTATTTYRGHHTTTGAKTGKKTYVAEFDAVTLNGHTYTQASCGTERTFAAKNLQPGDSIKVSLHGDVMVCVDGVVGRSADTSAASNGTAVPPVAPTPEPDEDGTADTITPTPGTSKWLRAKQVAAAVVAVFVAVANCTIFLSMMGVALFLMPLTGGAFSPNK